MVSFLLVEISEKVQKIATQEYFFQKVIPKSWKGIEWWPPVTV